MPPESSINPSRITRPAPKLRERLLTLVWSVCPHGPAFDALLSRRLPELRHLPERDPGQCIPAFDATPVTIRQCPTGAWSTPLIDVVVLTKCALGFQSRRILEIGSYLGSTARILAENTSDETRITTLDECPDHGEAYRGTPAEKKISRRVGKSSLEHFAPGDKYDLIFVDADHRFEAAANDTQVALHLLAEEGVIVWHDYQATDHFRGWNQVPEVLKSFATRISIVALAGTWLAIHSRHPGWKTATLLKQDRLPRCSDPWLDRSLRG